MTPNKTAWILSICLALTFVLYGCGSSEANGQNDQTVEPSAEISVTNVEVSSNFAFTDELVVVAVELSNEGQLAGDKELTLEADGADVVSHTASTGPPRSALDETVYTREVQLGWKPEESGDYELTVNGKYPRTVTVQEPTTKAEVTSATVNPGTEGSIEVGDPVVVLADVHNSGNAPGDVELALELDNESIAVETVSLDASPNNPERTALTFDFLWVPEQPGTFDLSVNGVDAGSVSVVGPPEVEILVPEKSDIQFAGVEDDSGDELAWYAEVELQGEAIDVVDGELGNEALEWRTTVDVDGDGQSETFSLGTGSTITTELYVEIDECGAIAVHHVELEATNSADISESAVIQIPVQMVKC